MPWNRRQSGPCWAAWKDSKYWSTTVTCSSNSLPTFNGGIRKLWWWRSSYGLYAREIEWHVGRLKGAAETGNLQSSFAAYAQRATVTYYIMTRHVLELYSQVGFPRLADLQQAL